MAKTWFIDIDGTIAIHRENDWLDEQLSTMNQTYGGSPDTILPGVKEFWASIPDEDIIVITSARHENHRILTELFLDKYSLRYNHIIMDLASGPRIVVNDIKPPGKTKDNPHFYMKTAFAINLERDKGPGKDLIKKAVDSSWGQISDLKSL